DLILRAEGLECGVHGTLTLLEDGVIGKIDDITGASTHILSLYDKLSDSNHSSPLLHSYATQSVSHHETCLFAADTIAARLGHSNTQFPLAEAQRDALSHALTMSDSDILAVNGPSSIKMSKLPKPRAIALKKLPQITHSKNVRTLVNNEPPYGSYLKLYPETDYSVLTSEYARFQNFITTNASQTDLHKENILLTAGAVDAFRLILDTFLEPAIDSVCIPIPTFFGLIHWSEVHGLNVVKTTLEKPHYNELNLDVILNSKTKAIVLCDPNNPIGTRLSHQQIKLLAHCYHGLVIIDEAYIEMSEAESNVALLKDLKNVMLIRTFSKALGLAGLRVGAILSNEENVRHLKSMQEPFILSTPVIQALKQELAVNTQRDDIQLFKERRAELIMILKTFKGIKRVYDSHTTFITIELFELESIVSALEKHDISVVIEPSGLKNTIRISLSNYDIVNKVVGILKNLNRIVEGLL
ncbi:aminotransferase class I/II-fold pyridoxal phosphate-dependent enzyme, partial [Vibrio sp. 1F263]|uniref:aminotransferase class I/II-fold pyridoxal phosphate-dependent enzyme n=1 Tax=Vibrio sp. 1F263 TaxID=3230012 RepID=UPI00352E26EE